MSIRNGTFTHEAVVAATRKVAQQQVDAVIGSDGFEERSRQAFLGFMHALPRDMTPTELLVYAAFVFGTSQDAITKWMEANHEPGAFNEHAELATVIGDLALKAAR